jgi:trehalose-6-phosphate synthase
LLAKKLGLDWSSVRRLVDVQKQTNKSLPELAQAVQQHLHKEIYTREEVAKELGLSVSLQIYSQYLNLRCEINGKVISLQIQRIARKKMYDIRHNARNTVYLHNIHRLVKI